jgi:hypothetical protein
MQQCPIGQDQRELQAKVELANAKAKVHFVLIFIRIKKNAKVGFPDNLLKPKCKWNRLKRLEKDLTYKFCDP